MKYMLLPLFTCLGLAASSQITVTNATFPAVGDTLRTTIDFEPNLPAALTPPGGAQTWDFTSAKNQQAVTTVYSPASDGNLASLFPGAQMAVLSPQSETYYKTSASKIEILGYAGADPANFGLNVTAKFAPPVALRRAPMNFFDINQSTTDLSIPFSTDALPDSLIQNIPGISSIDSIRFRINYQRLDVVDAWGTAKIPGGQYPVLREKRTEYTTTSMDVKVPFLGWIPISGAGGGGGGFLNFLGTDTTTTYRFFSNTEKEEIAVLTADNTNSFVERIVVKDNGVTSAAPESPGVPAAASISAFPNPAVEWVRFDCANLPPSEYTLKIFNIVGKTVWKETYQLSGTRSLRVELNDFKKGTYLYSLSDKKGTVVGTKRLVVVKP